MFVHGEVELWQLKLSTAVSITCKRHSIQTNKWNHNVGSESWASKLLQSYQEKSGTSAKKVDDCMAKMKDKYLMFVTNTTESSRILKSFFEWKEEWFAVRRTWKWAVRWIIVKDTSLTMSLYDLSTVFVLQENCVSNSHLCN